MKHKYNQQGFSPLFIILILLILAVLGFVGWRVWSERTPADSGASSTPAASTDKDGSSETPAPTYVMPVSEAFRVALPATWVSRTCADNADILFLAPTEDKLGTCSSESGGTLAISKNAGDTRRDEASYTSDSSYSSVSYSPITIDGITGTKVSYTIATESIIGYPPVGTQHVVYSLYDGTNTFSLVYTRLPGDADHAATVQTIAESFDVL